MGRLLDRTLADDILVLDRGFPSFDVFVMLALSKLDLVVRVPVGNFGAVADFLASGEHEGFVEIMPPKKRRVREALVQRH